MSYGKMPCATDTEAAVLGSILLNGSEWWDDVVTFTGNDVVSLFYNSEHAKIARIMDDISNNSEVVALNVPVFRDRLVATGMDSQRAREITQRVVQCGSLQSVDDLRAACSELMTYRSSRDMARILDDSQEDIREDYLNPLKHKEQIIEELESVSFPIANPPTAAELLEKTESESLPTWAVPTGLTKLDDMLNGGYSSGRLYILAAGTKVGKTTTAITNIERAISSGAVVIVFSLETIERDFVAKMLANMSQLDRRSKVEPFLSCDTPEQALEFLDTLPEDEQEQFMEARAMFRNSKLYPVFQSHLKNGFSSIIPYIRSVRNIHPDEPCVVFIDHLNLLTQHGTNVKGYEQLDSYTKELFKVAQSQDVAVVSLMQLNPKKNEGSSPSLESIRGSQAPSHNANTVILLDRDIVEENEDADVHKLKVKIAANRNGPAGEFVAYFDGARDYVGDAEEDDDDDDW